MLESASSSTSRSASQPEQHAGPRRINRRAPETRAGPGQIASPGAKEKRLARVQEIRQFWRSERRIDLMANLPNFGGVGLGRIEADFCNYNYQLFVL